MYDLAIIGAGPAGAAAAVYAARKKLKTILIAEEFGGQSIVSPSIENWIGTVAISGDDLKKALEDHVRAYANECVDIELNARATKVTVNDGGHYNIETSKDGSVHTVRSILVATGGTRRQLPAKNADKFEHKGLTYCASCDGPLFSGQDVVVVGGGNAGFETAAQLLAYTKSVTLLQRGDSYKADPVTVERVLEHENMTGILNADITEVLGDKFVSGIKYKDMESGEEKEIQTAGIFVEIGMIPNTDFIADIVDVDQLKRIVVDPRTQQTSKEGVWAAGDCTNAPYHQNNIAAGDAVKALEDIYLYLNAR